MDPYMTGSLLLFGVLLIVFAVVVLATIFWIWMLIECVTKEPPEGNDKIAWLLIILLANVVGALIYYFVRHAPRRNALGFY